MNNNIVYKIQTSCLYNSTNEIYSQELEEKEYTKFEEAAKDAELIQTTANKYGAPPLGRTSKYYACRVIAQYKA